MTKEKMGLNRTQIKYIAIISMLIDHTAALLLPPEKYPALTVLYVFMRTIGRIAGPVMFYFLAEGYRYTSSKLKYGLRLLSFGILSQVLYSLARYGETSLETLNVMFTLFMSFIMLVITDKLKTKVWQGIAVSAIMFLTAFSDWGVMGPFIVWLFYIYHEDRKKQLISYASLCMAQLVTAILIVPAGNIEWYEAVWQTGIFLPILLICGYNGESGRKNIINKWFFYLFYPLQFLVFWFILKT